MAKEAVRPFVELDNAARAKGWTVAIHYWRNGMPVIAVHTDDPDVDYSRCVETHESYDDCAKVILGGLRRSKVLPPRAKA